MIMCFLNSENRKGLAIERGKHCLSTKVERDNKWDVGLTILENKNRLQHHRVGDIGTVCAARVFC
jgi:hypothetical protein